MKEKNELNKWAANRYVPGKKILISNTHEVDESIYLSIKGKNELNK